MGWVRSLALGFGLATGGAATAESPWFLHEYGELRAYFDDWLVVCEDRGYGPCRAVHFEPDPEGDGFWGLARVALHHLPNGSYGIEFYVRDLVAEAADPVTITVDDWYWELTQDDWRPGEVHVRNVLESITITDPLITDDLLGAMQAGHDMSLVTGDGSAAYFSLDGLTASVLAMEQKALDNAQ